LTDDPRYDAVHVDANSVAALDEARDARLELLDGDEIIELSIKPSLWFVAIVSLRFILAVAVVAALIDWTARSSGAPLTSYVAILAVLGAAGRLAVAGLQWASRVYILTNRRVMRMAGVLNVVVDDCRLKLVGGTNLVLAPAPRLLGLGSIRITPSGDGQSPIVWEHVARAGAIYAKLVRAIKKAQSKR